MLRTTLGLFRAVRAPAATGFMVGRGLQTHISTPSAMFPRLGRVPLPQIECVKIHVRTFASRPPRKPRRPGKRSEGESEGESEEGQEQGPVEGGADGNGGDSTPGALISKGAADFAGSMVPRVEPLDVQNVIVIGTPRPFFPGMLPCC